MKNYGLNGNMNGYKGQQDGVRAKVRKPTSHFIVLITFILIMVGLYISDTKYTFKFYRKKAYV